MISHNLIFKDQGTINKNNNLGTHLELRTLLLKMTELFQLPVYV